MSTSDSAAVLDALRRIIRFLRLADREAEATHGVTAAQLFVLHCLSGAPVDSLAELARRTRTDQSSVSIVVARLETKKLIARKVSATDRRRFELRLTPAGKRIVETGPLMPQPKIIAAIDALPAAKRREVVRALELLARVMGAGEVEPTMLFEELEQPVRARRRSKSM